MVYRTCAIVSQQRCDLTDPQAQRQIVDRHMLAIHLHMTAYLGLDITVT